MDLVVLADLHIDVRGSRFDETERVNAWIAEEVKRRAPAAVLVAGDVFHRASTPGDRLYAAGFLSRLAKVCPVIGIAGNHDVEGDLALFPKLSTDHGVSFYERPDIHLLATGDAAVACVPWRREAPDPALLALPPAERKAAERAAIRAMLSGLADDMDRCDPATRIAIVHAMLEEADVKIGQPDKRGSEFLLSLDDLALLRADVIAIGHVHAGQSWTIGPAPVFYPGSTIRRSFGEREEKQIAVLHCDGPEVRVESVKTPARPMLFVEARWADQGTGSYGFALDEDALLAEASGADVRIRYDVEPAHREAAREAASALAHSLASAGGIVGKPEERLAATSAARAPEIATVASMRDKLAVTLTVKGCGPEAPQRERVLALFDRVCGSS